MASILPAFSVPDEASHWGSALSRLSMMKTGEAKICSRTAALVGALPAVAFDFKQKARTGVYQSIATVEPACVINDIPYGNVLTYAPVGLVQLVFRSVDSDGIHAVRGFFLARFTAGTMILLLLWRLVVVAGRRYRTVVPGLLSVLAFVMSPLFIQQSFATSADVIVNACAIQLATVFIAGNLVAWGDLLLLLVIGLVAADTKPVIAPLLLGFALAPLWLFPPSGGSRDRRHFIAAVGILLTLACAAFTALAMTAHQFASTHDPAINIKGQIAFMLANPLHLPRITWDTTATFINGNLFTDPLGWLDTPLPADFRQKWGNILKFAMSTDFLIALLLIGRRLKDSRPTVRATARIVTVYAGLITMVFASVFAVAVVMYLVWTPVGWNGLAGIQPRYLIPSIILGLMMLAPAAQLTQAARTSSGDTPPPYRPWQTVVTAATFAVLGVNLFNALSSVLVAFLQRFY